MYVLVLMAPADTLRIASMATYYFSSIDIIFALRGRCATEVVVDLRMAIPHPLRSRAADVHRRPRIGHAHASYR